jgi:hypothetical protein
MKEMYLVFLDGTDTTIKYTDWTFLTTSVLDFTHSNGEHTYINFENVKQMGDM